MSNLKKNYVPGQFMTSLAPKMTPKMGQNQQKQV